MIGTMVHQLTDGASPKEMAAAGLSADYVNHGLGIYPQSAGGIPYTAQAMQSKGDPITDLYENIAAEQKARQTYEYLLDLIDDPDVAEPIRFLREREVVHFQRFGEAMRIVEDYYDSKRMFVFPTRAINGNTLWGSNSLLDN
jgi:spore coat protein JC